MWINKSLSKTTETLFPPASTTKTPPSPLGREAELSPQPSHPPGKGPVPGALYALLLPSYYP